MTRNVAVIVAEVLTILALTVACIFNFGGMKPGGKLDTRYLALVRKTMPNLPTPFH